jgi:hypothetical protein
LAVFKTAAFNRSATTPGRGKLVCHNNMNKRAGRKPAEDSLAESSGATAAP